MFERINISFDLLAASGAILRKNRLLLIFPCISTVAALLVAATFALPLSGMHDFAALSDHSKAPAASVYAALFVFYVFEYSVVFFFNTALVGAVMMQIDGDTPTVGDGLRIAWSKIYSIIGYAMIAATVGMLLRALEERLGWLGRFVVGLLGIGWTLATYLVIPVLAARDVGPMEAVTQSAELFKRTWGVSAIAATGIGLAFLLIQCVLIACAAALIGFTQNVLHSAFLTIVSKALAVGAVVLVTLIFLALSGIYRVALYRYANGSKSTFGFDVDELGLAFQPKD